MAPGTRAGCAARHLILAPSSLALVIRVILLTVMKVPLRDPLYTFSDTSDTKMTNSVQFLNIGNVWLITKSSYYTILDEFSN